MSNKNRKDSKAIIIVISFIQPNIVFTIMVIYIEKADSIFIRKKKCEMYIILSESIVVLMKKTILKH